jgi:hypothetical protein
MLYVMAHVKGAPSYEFMTQRELDGQIQTMWVGSFASGLGSCENCITSSDFINGNKFLD